MGAPRCAHRFGRRGSHDSQESEGDDYKHILGEIPDTLRKVLDPSCVGAPLVVDGHVAGLVVVKRVEEEYIPYFKRGSVDATTGRHGAAHVGGAGAGAGAGGMASPQREESKGAADGETPQVRIHLALEVQSFESLIGEISAARQQTSGSALRLWFKDNMWSPIQGRAFPDSYVAVVLCCESCRSIAHGRASVGWCRA